MKYKTKNKKMSRAKVLSTMTIVAGFSKSYKDIHSLIAMGIEREKLLSSKKDIYRAKKKTLRFFENLPKNLMEGESEGIGQYTMLFFLNYVVDILKTQRSSKTFYLSDIKNKVKKEIKSLDMSLNNKDLNTGGVFKSEILIGILNA